MNNKAKTEQLLTRFTSAPRIENINKAVCAQLLLLLSPEMKNPIVRNVVKCLCRDMKMYFPK